MDKLNKLEKIVDLLENDKVTHGDFEEIFDMFYQVVEELKKQYEQSLEDKTSEIKSENDNSTKKLGYLISEVELNLKNLINSSEKSSLDKIKELSQRLYLEINRVEEMISALPDLSSIKNEIETIKRNIPVIPEIPVLDPPKQLADKLNTLKSEIKPEVIIGWSDIEKKLNNNSSLPRDFDVRIGVSKTELRRLENRVTDLEDNPSGGGHTIQDEGSDLTQRTNLNFVGSGVAVTDDAGNDATVVTINSGGFSLLTATGTVNGTNTSFTFTSAPSIIVVDGVPRQKTQSDGSTNWSGTTSVTLSVAPNFDIFGM